MQVYIENLSPLERRMTVKVPSERFESEVAKRLQQTAGKAKIPGFRPGKVPLSVVKQRYEPSIRQEVLGDLIQTTYQQAIMEQKLNPAGPPSVEPKAMENDSEFEYIATFEVFPEVIVKGLNDIQLERIESDVTEADIQTMLNNLRKQSAQFNSVDREARLDDKVIIDFEGAIEGEVFEGGTSQDAPLILGSNRMIPGFEEGLLGAKSGETRVIHPSFPKEYPQANLAGKTADFKVTVKDVAEPVMPELNEAFFSQYGMSGDLEAFQAEIKKNMTRELKHALKTKIKHQAMDALLLVNPMEIPKAAIHHEIDNLRAQAAQKFGGGLKADQLPAELFEEQAKKRVTLGLLVSQLIEDLQLKADESRVRQHIEDMASVYQDSSQVVAFYYKNPKQMAEVKAVVLEDQLVEALLEKAKVTTKHLPYDEAVKPHSASVA